MLPLSDGMVPLARCSLPVVAAALSCPLALPKGPGTCFSGARERRDGALEEKLRSKMKWDPTAVHGTRVVTGGLWVPWKARRLQTPSEPHRNAAGHAERDIQEHWGTVPLPLQAWAPQPLTCRGTPSWSCCTVAEQAAGCTQIGQHLLMCCGDKVTPAGDKR